MYSYLHTIILFHFDTRIRVYWIHSIRCILSELVFIFICCTTRGPNSCNSTVQTSLYVNNKLIFSVLNISVLYRRVTMSPVMLTRVHHVSRLQSTCQRLLSTSRVSPAQFLDSAEEAVADIDPGSRLLGTVHEYVK